MCSFIFGLNRYRLRFSQEISSQSAWLGSWDSMFTLTWPRTASVFRTDFYCLERVPEMMVLAVFGPMMFRLQLLTREKFEFFDSMNPFSEFRVKPLDEN